MGMQAGNETKLLLFNGFDSVNSKTSLSCLNRFMMLISSIKRDLWLVFEGNVIRARNKDQKLVVYFFENRIFYR